MVFSTAYRYEECTYSVCVDEYTEYYSSTVRVNLIQFDVLKETPKGFWIKYFNDKGKKFILKNSKKKFACFNKDDAKESFIARKKSQIRIYQGRISVAEQSILYIENRII